MVQYGPKWSNMVKYGPKWSKMVMNGSKIVQTCPDGPKGYNLVHYGPNLCLKNHLNWSNKTRSPNLVSDLLEFFLTLSPKKCWTLFKTFSNPLEKIYLRPSLHFLNPPNN